MKQIRQGDVLLIPVSKLPRGCEEIKPEGGRIVLMHGEVTGHAHAIYDHESGTADPSDAALMTRAGKIAQKALANAASRAKARLMRTPDGTRYLEVFKPVSLDHEEHTSHKIAPGIYEIPVQCEHTTERMVRQVQD